jgi:predicted dehydrogenase
MSRKFKWGIIGTGGIAAAFARDLAYLSDHEVSVIGSRDGLRAREFAREFGASSVGSYEELVTSDVDAIYVATPHSAHAENSILALNAGKPVLCEKPFAVNSDQVRAMIESARSNGVALMEAMWSRFLPNYRRVRELIGEGEIGEVVAIYADHGQPLPADTHYRLHAPELAGGALLDLGVYPISLANMILGAPDLVLATSTPTKSGVDAQTSMIFSYESGAQAVLTTTLEVRTPCTAKIIGTDGRIEIDSNFYTPTSMRLITTTGTTEFPRQYEGHGLREQAQAFSGTVREGSLENPIMSWRESLEVMETMDLIREQIELSYPFE